MSEIASVKDKTTEAALEFAQFSIYRKGNHSLFIKLFALAVATGTLLTLVQINNTTADFNAWQSLVLSLLTGVHVLLWMMDGHVSEMLVRQTRALQTNDLRSMELWSPPAKANVKGLWRMSVIGLHMPLIIGIGCLVLLF